MRLPTGRLGAFARRRWEGIRDYQPSTRLVILVAVCVGMLAASSTFASVYSLIELKQAQERLEDTQDRQTKTDRRLGQLSVSNCTTINENTKGLYQLLLILQQMVNLLKEEGTLPEDAEIILEEPKSKNCKRFDVVPRP